MLPVRVGVERPAVEEDRARGADVAVALAGLGQERLLDALALDLVLGPVAALAGLTGS